MKEIFKTDGKYKEQWNNYFEGGIEMWTYFGYQYHSYKIVKYLVSELDIPSRGHIVQIGTGLGITVEYLCNVFGEDRVTGYDLFNPLGHPNIKFLDAEKALPTFDICKEGLAYIDIDVGSMSHAKGTRKTCLDWALEHTLKDGYILTNKSLEEELRKTINNRIPAYTVMNLNDFNVPELWENPHQNRLNTKILLKVA